MFNKKLIFISLIIFILILILVYFKIENSKKDFYTKKTIKNYNTGGIIINKETGTFQYNLGGGGR